MFDFRATPLPGCYEIVPKVADDARGRFVKVFHAEAFAAQGLDTGFVESYYSHSRQGVLRGLHFQLPPHDHAKLVYCTAGRVWDVVVDLRRGSPAYGQHAAFNLDAESAHLIYIPCGMAHGFCVLSERATLVYQVSSLYSPEHDAGIRWDTLGIPWPVTSPLLSARDQAFPAFAEFESPFRYD